MPEQSKKINKKLPYNINKKPTSHNLLNFVNKKINPQVEQKLPNMNHSTKQFLDNYFKQELEGINNLLMEDVLSVWFK